MIGLNRCFDLEIEKLKSRFSKKKKSLRLPEALKTCSHPSCPRNTRQDNVFEGEGGIGILHILALLCHLSINLQA